MPHAAKHVYQVRDIISHDTVVVAHVKEDGKSLNLWEVRDPKLVVGGIGSCWASTSQPDKAGSHTAKATIRPSGSGKRPPTPSLPMYLANEQHRDFTDASRLFSFEKASLTSPTRLTVAFSLGKASYDEVIEDLRVGDLKAPSTDIDAIEVREGVWIRKGFRRLENKSLSFERGTQIRAMEVVCLANRPATLRLASGLVIFTDPPQWTSPTIKDLRSEKEFLNSAQALLGRIAAGVTSAPTTSTAEMTAAVRSWIATTVNEDEAADLERMLEIASSRQRVIELLPSLMSNDPEWRKQLHVLRETEQASVREAVEAEEAHLKAELNHLRVQVEEARGNLGKLTMREQLLREATQEHDARLRDMVAEAARTLGTETRAIGRRVHDEMDALRTEFAEAIEKVKTQIPAQAVAMPAPAAPDVTPQMRQQQQPVVAARETLKFSTDQSRRNLISEVADVSVMKEPEVIAALVYGSQGIPVLVGDAAATIATDLAASIGGERSAIVFCDPTHVTISDLLREDRSGLGTAVRLAEERDDVLIPVALCGITRAPCEFWIPQLVEMRRVGRLPRNLLFIASAGADGQRIEVPSSVLRYLFPFDAGSKTVLRAPDHAGAWPPLDPHDARGGSVGTAALAALARGEAGAMEKMIELLRRVPNWVVSPLQDVAAVLARENAWLSATRGTGESEFMKYFQKLGE